MFEPEDLYWEIKRMFEAHEPIEYIPRRSFLSLAPPVRPESFEYEAARARAHFDALARVSQMQVTPTQKKRRIRDRTEYMRTWRKRTVEARAAYRKKPEVRAQENAYTRTWRARRRAA